MQLSAISHRPDSEDAFLYDKDHLRIRLHTAKNDIAKVTVFYNCLLYTSPSPRDLSTSRMPSSA